jgi:hypothetical protein
MTDCQAQIGLRLSPVLPCFVISGVQPASVINSLFMRTDAMIQTVEAVVDADGTVRLLGPVRVTVPQRALVTILDEPATIPHEAALLSEAALATDWSRPEEDAAWEYLQPAK